MAVGAFGCKDVPPNSFLPGTSPAKPEIACFGNIISDAFTIIQSMESSGKECGNGSEAGDEIS